MYTRRTRSFFRARVQSSNNARISKSYFTTEKIVNTCEHMTVFEIVVHRNVDNWVHLLT